MKQVFFLVMAAVAVLALSPKELAQQSKDLSKGFKAASSQMELLIISKDKSTVKRAMKSLSIESSRGDDGDMSLIEFTLPSDVKGTKLLTHQKLSRADDQWLYLPAIKRVKRITSSSKTGSFMGSEFSFEDIASGAVEKYTYSSALGSADLDGEQVYTYERYPLDENSGYTKQVVFVKKDIPLVLKIEYYDKKNALLKISESRGYEQINGIWSVGEITMQNVQNEKSSVIRFLERKNKLELSPALFTQKALER